MAPRQEPQRHRLTLTQLASYDDLLTDLLINKVFYWTRIRKNKAKDGSSRRFSELEVTAILRDHIVLNHDPAKAEQMLLDLPGVKREHERLKTKKEREDFRKHMRKYIHIWCKDCPFEISTTNRYQIDNDEGAVFARKPIERGEIIKYLCGNLVSMTQEEEQDLDLKRKDFSIVMSSRRKTPSLFLGPARFANHDCNANAGLVTTGSDGMRVVALRKIAIDEEITVSYGVDYFGENNCECLCRTCELTERNGWNSTSQSYKAPALLPASPRFLSKRTIGSSLRNQASIRASSVASSSAIGEENADPHQNRKRKIPHDITADLLQDATETDEAPPTKRARNAHSKGTSPSKFREENTTESISGPSLGTNAVPTTLVGPRIGTHDAEREVSEVSERLMTSAQDLLSDTADVLVSKKRRHSLGQAAAEPSGTSKRRHSLQGLPAIMMTFDAVETPAPESSAIDSACEEDELVLLPEDNATLGQGKTDGLLSETKDASGVENTTVEVNGKEFIKTTTQNSSPSSDVDSIFDERDRKRSSTPVSTGYTPRFDETLLKDSLRMENSASTSPDGEVSGRHHVAEHDAESAHEEKVDVTITEVLRHRTRQPGDADSDLSDLSSNESFDDSRQSIIRKPRTRSYKPHPLEPRAFRRATRTPTLSTPGASQPPEDLPHRLVGSGSRYPGDYVRTPELLRRPDARWVDCRTCTATFVQKEGAQTQRECHRCERHSKLYGYTWPKIEKGQASFASGKPSAPTVAGTKRKRAPADDDEERVLDHRTVYRFIDALEEPAEHRKGKGLVPPSEEIVAELAAAAARAREIAAEEEAELARQNVKKRVVYGYGKGQLVAVKRPWAASAGAARTGRKKMHHKTLAALHRRALLLKRNGPVKASVVGKARGAAAAAAAAKGPGKRGPGRPLGSKNLPKDQDGRKIGGAKGAKRGGATDAEVKAHVGAKKRQAPAPKAPRVPGTGAWKGWVPLEEGQEHETMELAMARIAAGGVGGTRGGTRIGRH